MYIKKKRKKKMTNRWKENTETYVHSPKYHNPVTSTKQTRVVAKEGYLKKRSSTGVKWVERYFKLIGVKYNFL